MDLPVLVLNESLPDKQPRDGEALESTVESHEPRSQEGDSSGGQFIPLTGAELEAVWAKLMMLQARAKSLPDPSLDRHFDYLPLNKWDETPD